MQPRAATVAPREDSISDPRVAYAAERADAVERRIARTRVAAAALGTFFYASVMDHAGTLPWLAWGTLTGGWIYGLYMAFLRGAAPSSHPLSGYLETVIDGVFTLLWIVATGGVESEFYVLIYGAVVAVAFKHGYRESLVGAALYALGYMALVAALGQLGEHFVPALIRASMVLLIGPLGALLAREAIEQGGAKVEMQELTRAAEAARTGLEKSLSMLRATLDSTGDGIIVVDNAARIVELNQRYLDMWNLPRRLVEARDHRRIIDHVLEQIDEPEGFYPRTREIQTDLTSESFDVLELKDGRIFERYSRPQRINDRTVGRVWSFRDVTDRRRAEAALQESEAKFRQIFDVSADAVAVSRIADGKVLEVNESYCKISGYSREDVVGKTAVELGVWVDVEVRKEALERLRRDGAVHNLEADFRCKNGSILYGLVSACQAPIAGEPCMVWFVRDIAEEKRAQEAVRRSEEKYRTLFEESKDALFLATLDGGLLDANPAAVELFGYDSKEEFLRLRPEAFLIDAENRGVARRAVEKEGFLRDFEMRAKRGDGEIVTILLNATPMRDERGELVGIRGLVRDVTGQRRLEAQLRQAQKLEALGRLAAGVAHEVNNPLTWVLSHLEALRDDLPRLDRSGNEASLVEPLLRRIGEAMEGTQRVARIVRDLQTFTRTEEEKRTAADVNSILEEALSVTAGTIRLRARLVKDLGQAPPLWCNPGSLSQVFVHLLTNAAQAIEEGQVERNEVRVRSRRHEGDVVVEISDTGSGIAPENRDEIFDPYFTTRPIGEGLGLGLSISRNVVAAHGGRIEVESERGAGSRFTVRLPADARKQVSPPERPSSPRAEGPRARILIVDDEPLVRAAVASSLRIEYEVVEAASGRQALEILQRDSGFEAILCDLMMPGVSGMELYDTVRETAPELAKRIVFMTGGAFTRSAEAFLARVANRCLEKPFTGPELLGVVRRIIAAEAG